MALTKEKKEELERFGNEGVNSQEFLTRHQMLQYTYTQILGSNSSKFDGA